MSVRLRLQRHGAKKNPFYRVVATDQRAPRDGRFIEILGTYNPLPDPPEIRLDRKRVEYWLGVGAQPSNTVRSLIRKMNRGEPVIDLSEEGAEAAAKAAKAAARKQAKEEARKQAAEEAAKKAKEAEKAEEEAKAEEKAEEAEAAGEEETESAEEAKEEKAEEKADEEEATEESGDKDEE